jgi:hypothetical protein
VPNFNTDQEFPLTLKIAQKGLARIKIDDLESIDNTTDIYIKDALTGKTHPINNQTFEIELDAGTYTDRFALVFAPHNALGVEEEMLEQGLSVFMNNSAKELQINNTIQAVLTSIRLYNSLGQLQQVWNQNLEQSRLALPINTKATGMYLVQIKTTTGNFTKKVVIE